ncbi:MAG TPA: class IV adenylate cyclase [Thermoanaerobaculia bacterium]|nr:class IV adenylate cyclase [Thermoanaerobaculia bacterium]
MSAGEAGRREEIEIKLPVAALSPVRDLLSRTGARLHAPRHDESNDLYDDPERSLSGSGRTVRLRRAAGRAVLTYKGVSRFESGTRVREEREIDVSDAGEADAILAGLGLTKTFRYEKRREEWDSEGCVVALDETPIGDFVEIEGDPGAIRRVVAALGLDASEAVPYSYPELYLRRRKEDPSLPADMVFVSRER